MGKIVLEDFYEGDGYYKVNLAYLSKDQVEEIEALVSKWNPTDGDIKNCIAMCLTDANEQRFKDYGTNLKDCLVWLEKQGKKPAEVEPKFKVGDWIVTSYGKVNQVITVGEDGDGFTLDDGTYFSGSWKDGYHLWTIEDAKDGDVLVDEYNNIGIYEKIVGICWHSYIYLGCDNRLYDFGIGGSHRQNNTKPATKEQRDLLFAKMKELGYEWDAEKKQIIKL